MLKNITGKKILVLLGLYLLFALIIFPSIPQSKAGIPDLKFFYTPAQVYEIIAEYSASERMNYAFFSMTVDVLYPIIYSLFLTSLSILLITKLSESNKTLVRLAFISFVAAFFDLLENLSLTIMMLNYPVKLNVPAALSGYFTAAKWTLVIVAILYIFYLTILLAIQKISSKKMH